MQEKDLKNFPEVFSKEIIIKPIERKKFNGSASVNKENHKKYTYVIYFQKNINNEWLILNSKDLTPREFASLTTIESFLKKVNFKITNIKAKIEKENENNNSI